MRPLLTLAFLVSLAAPGCAAQRVHTEAAITLDCEDVQVNEDRAHQCWIADGCGRRAFCVLPEVERAEPMCVGGGPAVAAY